MTTTLYGVTRSPAQTDLTVTALHAGGFGPSDISILDAGKEEAVSHLARLGLPEAEAQQYCLPLPAGTHLITVTANTEDQVYEAKKAFAATSVGTGGLLSS